MMAMIMDKPTDVQYFETEWEQGDLFEDETEVEAPTQEERYAPRILSSR